MESPDSYTTPTWIEAGGRAELIVTGGDVVSGHDPATGREYWRANVLNPDNNRSYRIVASPTIVGNLIIAPTRNNPMVAMRPGGTGDVAGSHVVWTFAQGPDVPTPVSDGTLLYVVRDNGVVYALDVKTGATVYGPERLPSGTYSASPDPGGRPDLRHDRRGRPHHGLSRRSEVRDPGDQFASRRLLAVLPQHGGRVRRPDLPADLLVSVGDRRAEARGLTPCAPARRRSATWRGDELQGLEAGLARPAHASNDPRGGRRRRRLHVDQDF